MCSSDLTDTSELPLRPARVAPTGEVQNGASQPPQHRELGRPLAAVFQLPADRSPSTQFASFRSPLEERDFSRTAFFKFCAFLLVSTGMRFAPLLARRAATLLTCSTMQSHRCPRSTKPALAVERSRRARADRRPLNRRRDPHPAQGTSLFLFPRSTPSPAPRDDITEWINDLRSTLVCLPLDPILALRPSLRPPRP